MVISAEALLVIVLIGLTAGWLAGRIVGRAGSRPAGFELVGFGLVGDLVIGVGGAFLGGWLLPQLGVPLGAGLVGAIINAGIGALLLLFIMGPVRGRGGWRRNRLGW